ncbi:MAG TPA: hypothetical protein ENJ93_04220 [Chloroflexi bacterium]|nr:hypothetical protein [Chloroflexota bacterium]
MTAVVNFVILLLALSAFVAAVYFVIRAFRYKGQSVKATYNVGQVEARRAMQVDFIRAVAAFLVGLIMLGVVGWLNPFNVDASDESNTPVEAEPSPVITLTPATIVPSPLPTNTADQPIITEPAMTATAVPLPPSPTPLLPATDTAVPLPTDTPQPTTATVQSGVGVWLRSIPSTDGDQVEWLLDGAILELLPGLESDGELDWQQVRAPSGNEGWVAVPFIVYNE